MSDDDLEPRVRALEERMTLQEGLRASQERDLAAVELRTRQIVTGLDAVNEKVEAHSRILDRHSATLDEHSERLERIEQKVTTTNGLLEQFALDTIVRFRQADVRFGQVDVRFEQVDARFGQVEGRIDSMSETLAALASGQIDNGRLLAELVAKVDRLVG
jgi:uncharacterized coiled-coil protein SlyX